MLVKHLVTTLSLRCWAIFRLVIILKKKQLNMPGTFWLMSFACRRQNCLSLFMKKMMKLMQFGGMSGGCRPKKSLGLMKKIIFGLWVQLAPADLVLKYTTIWGRAKVVANLIVLPAAIVTAFWKSGILFLFNTTGMKKGS